MCSIFGWTDYKGIISHKLAEALTNALATCATVRGTDATGISYVRDGNIEIYKVAKPAYEVELKIPEGTRAVVGHTRMSTHGSETHNFNNHPFRGKCKNTTFAFAHNGVLSNYKAVQTKYGLPATKIETDSYAAVQLLEHYGKLSFESIKNMSEAVSGSFMFTMIDQNNSIWLSKGSNPITIYNYEELGIVVYASTTSILEQALETCGILDSSHIDIKMTEGDIFKFDKNGKLTKSEFDSFVSYYRDYSGYRYNPHDYYYNQYRNKSTTKNTKTTDSDSKIVVADSDYEVFLQVCSLAGISKDDIAMLLGVGYTQDEIEDLAYKSETEIKDTIYVAKYYGTKNDGYKISGIYGWDLYD